MITLDLFLVDWEELSQGARPKKGSVARSKISSSEEQQAEISDDREDAQKLVAGDKTAAANCWRRILIANELCEMLTQRLSNIGLLFIGFVFVWFGLDQRVFAQSHPSEIVSVSQSPDHKLLMFFLSLVILLGFGLLQVIVQRMFRLWAPLSPELQVDLCSVANVSVVILDENFHGQYIHGQCTEGNSEISMVDMQLKLKREETGSGKGRGLVATDPQQLQTFEIFLSQKQRDLQDGYWKDKVTEQEVKEEGVKMKKKMDQNKLNLWDRIFLNQNMQMGGRSDPVNRISEANEMEQKRKKMEVVFRNIVDEAKTDESRVQEKTASQRMIGLPDVNMNFNDKCLFYKDREMSFVNVLAYGLDQDLMIMDIMIFEWVFIYLNGNVFTALLMAQLADKSVMQIMRHFGVINLSQKMFIDKGFLK